MDAEDCAQEALLALLTQPDDRAAVFSDEAGWVGRVAARRYIDVVRRRAREQQWGDRLDVAGAISGPETRLVRQSEARRVLLGLRRLPLVTQEVCHAVASGHSVTQIARQLELSPRSVEGHLARARCWLRRLAALVAIPGLWLLRPFRGAVNGSAAGTTAVAALVVPSVLAGVLLLPTDSANDEAGQDRAKPPPVMTHRHQAPSLPLPVAPASADLVPTDDVGSEE